MLKIQEIAALIEDLESKYGDDMDYVPKEEYKNFNNCREEFLKNTGLNNNQLCLLMDLDKYGLFEAVNDLVLKTTFYLKEKGELPEKGEFISLRDVLKIYFIS